MVYSSMKKLLKKFPYFLKKSSDSNFYKSEHVFNEQFKEIYNDIFQVYESFHLQKRLLVWRSQSEAYEYNINFIANYPNLKSVTCYKNDEVIYSEAYNYEDEVSTFWYVYEGTSETIIPTDKFKIVVESFDEYWLVKGFPENTNSTGDIYDHDSSLDNFGLLHNIPRKTYRTIHQFDEDIYYMYKGKEEINFDELTLNDIDNNPLFKIFNTQGLIEYYTQTEYPFNNEASEDDYHYMNRIINYVNYLHDYPLPVLEIWKIYGLPLEEIELINRERYLCKMFEESRHVDSEGIYDSTWKPKPWEHKDAQCGKRKEDIFFFANVNNASPIQGRTIKFSFQFFNEYARKILKNYYIAVFIRIVDDEDRPFERYYDCYPDASYIDTSTRGFSWPVNTDNLPGVEEGAFSFDFVFYAYEDLADLEAMNTNYIESDTIRVTIKGCNNADLYVDCVTGDDNNPGTAEEPLRTLPYAISRLEGFNNVIVLVNKNKRFYIDDIQKITESCSIISCPKDAVIYQNNGFEFFRVFQDNHLYLQGIYLKHKCCEMYAEADDFINNNTKNYPLRLTIPKWVCKINTKIVMAADSYDFYAHKEYTVGGVLSVEEDSTPIQDATIELYNANDELLDSTTTDNNGEYSLTNSFIFPGDYALTVKYPETKRYCNSEATYTAHVVAMPTTLTASTVEKINIDGSFTVTYNIKDHFNTPVTTGVLELYEDNVLVETIDNGETLTYTPTTAGVHNYRLVFTDDGYVTSEVQFTVKVIKSTTEIALIGEGKSVYLEDENVPLTGLIMDEEYNPISNASLKLYCDDTLITTLTSDMDGEVSWSDTLPVGRHTLHLECDETHGYYGSVSNNYNVLVRDETPQEIILHLYPDHKVLLSQPSSVGVSVYATDNQGNPISTTFKIWDTYNNSCELNPRAECTTGADGWWHGNVSTQAIIGCEGTYLQAISTVDEDICSNSAHIMYTAEPEFTVTGDISTVESSYSYSDDVIHVTGYLVDEEDNDPVPNEQITVKMLDGSTIIGTKTISTDVKGEFNTTFTTNSTVRGHNLTFRVEYAGVTDKYTSFTDTTTLPFKQLDTVISAEDVSKSSRSAIVIPGSVIDENMKLVDTGSVRLTCNGRNYNANLVNGAFSGTITETLTPGTYTVTILFIENTYYDTSTTDITLTIFDPSITILDTENGPWDITLVDEFPPDVSGYDDEDYIIRTEYLDDGNPKLTLTDDPDYDPSGGSEDDIILIDDDDDPEIVVEDE